MKSLVLIAFSCFTIFFSLNAQTTGCTGSASISVVIEDCTSTAEIPGVKLFEVTPNPANEMVRISFVTTEKMNGNIRLIEASGKIIFQESLEINGEFSKNISIDKFPAGIYWVVFQNTKSVSSRKLIIE